MILKKLLVKTASFAIRLPAAVWNAAALSGRGTVRGRNVTVRGRLYVRNQGCLEIGKDVRINSGAYFNPIGGDVRTNLIVSAGARIIIGDGCRISNSTLFSEEEIQIGPNVLIGGGCKIYDTDFHPLDFETRAGNPIGGGETAKVSIGEGAFIGAHSIILKGTTIGKHAVIGAGSVVSGRVPDDEIWAGNPARRIRKITDA